MDFKGGEMEEGYQSNNEIWENRMCHFYQKYVYLTESTLQKLMQQNDSYLLFLSSFPLC